MNAWALTFDILFIVATLFLTIAAYWTIKWPNWKTEPYNALSDVISELGFPTMAKYSSGGMAVWNSSVLKDEPWSRVMIRDEAILHCCPKPHNDFLYSSICIEIPNALVEMMVLSLSKSIWYDSLKKRLWIRCNSLRANVATALMVTQLLLSSQDNTSDSYDYYWNNTDEIETTYSAFVTAVNAASDDVYQTYKTQLQADLNKLGCPQLDTCDDTDCSTPWDAATVQSVLTSTDVNTIPPTAPNSNSVESYAHEQNTEKLCGGDSQCSVRDSAAGGAYALGPGKTAKKSKKTKTAENSKNSAVANESNSTKQPLTMGYSHDDSLPFNALSLTRESYKHNILADSRQEVDNEKVGISRSQKSLNSKTNKNIHLARHESLGPLHHPNIDYSLARHNSGVENYTTDMTKSECKACNVKRNGRPMTISAV